MKRFFSLIFIALIGVLVLTGCQKRSSWHQRLTLHMITPDGAQSFSSVSDVDFTGQIKWAKELSNSTSRLRGEAIVADLNGRYLFVLLDGVERLLFESVFASLDDRMAYSDATGLVRKQRTPLPVPRKLYPMMVVFEDINDPTSVRLVDPNNLAATFGEGYALTHLTIEATKDPVTEGQVEQVLGWLEQQRGRIKPTDTKLEKNLLPEEKLYKSDFLKRKKP